MSKACSLLIVALWALSAVSGRAEAAEPPLTDHRGRIFPAGVKRQAVASVFVGADEIIFALLEDEPQRLLALSPLSRDERYSSLYKETKSWRIVGDELESLVKLKPDLVLAARYTRADWLQLLEAGGVATFVFGDFSSIEDAVRNIEVVGRLLGKEPRARELIATFRARLQRSKVACGLAGKKVVNYSRDGNLLGKGTTFDSMLRFLDARNLGAELGIVGWTKISEERLLRLDPDLIVLEGDPATKAQRLAELRADPLWKHLPAVKAGRIIVVTGRKLSSVSQHIADAVEEICAQP